jgi:hypothetical protein
LTGALLHLVVILAADSLLLLGGPCIAQADAKFGSFPKRHQRTAVKQPLVLYRRRCGRRLFLRTASGRQAETDGDVQTAGKNCGDKLPLQHGILPSLAFHPSVAPADAFARLPVKIGEHPTPLSLSFGIPPPVNRSAPAGAIQQGRDPLSRRERPRSVAPALPAPVYYHHAFVMAPLPAAVATLVVGPSAPLAAGLMPPAVISILVPALRTAFHDDDPLAPDRLADDHDGGRSVADPGRQIAEAGGNGDGGAVVAGHGGEGAEQDACDNQGDDQMAFHGDLLSAGE